MEPTAPPIPPALTTSPETIPPNIREHVIRTPGTCGGRPRIVGSRVQVKHVVIWHERMGRSPGQIVSDHPHLTLADIYAALAYYHDHREEINADFQAERREYDEMKATRPSLLREKLEQRKADAPDDPLPPR